MEVCIAPWESLYRGCKMNLAWQNRAAKEAVSDVRTISMPSAIADYALIGDCETAALVDRNGSMDWLCVPRFDSPACFAALLGSPENGQWRISPAGKYSVSRRYRPHTLILETEFRTATGRATLIDFMPIRFTAPRVIRIVRGDAGTVAMSMDLAIRFDYGLTVPWVTQSHGALFAVAGPHRLILRSSVAVRGKGLRSVSDFTVKAGHSVSYSLEYGDSFKTVRHRATPAQSLKKTERDWRKWAACGCYHGRYAEAVERSLITLKALIYSPTGGIVAAPTTSLPEKPGGRWNWDYRYCWLRDATFTLLGFIHAGFHEEAQKWRNWLIHAAAGNPEQMQIMYGVTGEKLLREWTVPWLSGYQNSKPVRVGNAASEQLQLDVYGELADALFQVRSSVSIRGINFHLQVALLRHLEKIWRHPDNGVWEIRGKKQHYTHSKVMAWVAFDRMIRNCENDAGDAPIDTWRRVRQEIHDDVCRCGFDPKLNSFVRCYGSKEMDASLLLLPLVGFLPHSDSRIVGTVARVEKCLLRNGFVMRYEGAIGKGSGNAEGAFLPCSLWLADNYELAGRHRDARRLLDSLLKVRNDVGLLAEEYHIQTKQMVGNFPQAWSHVALVNSVMNLHTAYGPAHQRSNHRRSQARTVHNRL
jgi:GH15 family glucan-1,4-alpha-glucosidase